MFEQESYASQVRTAVKALPQTDERFVVVVAIRIVTFVPSQASRAMGGSKLQAVPQLTFLALLQTKSGGVVSTTVMVWLQRARLVHWSVASQVRVALMPLPQRLPWLVVVLTTTRVTFVEQLSLTLGIAKFHTVPHSTVRLFPQLISGGVVSLILTVCPT